MTTAQLLGYALGWGIAALFTTRDRHGCYYHPRTAAVLNAVACAVCVYGAHERGAGTWTGLLFAAAALAAAWWTLDAAGDSWAAWSVKRDPAGVARKVAAWRAKRGEEGK